MLHLRHGITPDEAEEAVLGNPLDTEWQVAEEKNAEERLQQLGETAAGRVRQGSLKQRGITPPTTIRLAPEDISRARTLAERRGLRYQTYLKMLIHEALEREERVAS